MFSNSAASDQGACARHQYETTDGAEDPRREKRAEDAVFGRVGATNQHQRRQPEINRRGSQVRLFGVDRAPSIRYSYQADLIHASPGHRVIAGTALVVPFD